jgi:hypothetical protein
MEKEKLTLIKPDPVLSLLCGSSSLGFTTAEEADSISIPHRTDQKRGRGQCVSKVTAGRMPTLGQSLTQLYSTLGVGDQGRVYCREVGTARKSRVRSDTRESWAQ